MLFCPIHWQPKAHAPHYQPLPTHSGFQRGHEFTPVNVKGAAARTTKKKKTHFSYSPSPKLSKATDINKRKHP